MSKIFKLVLLAVVIAVVMDYVMFTGDSGKVIQDYMSLNSAEVVSSSKTAFVRYSYQVAQQGEQIPEGGIDYSVQTSMGQALADAAYAAYEEYREEKDRRGRKFGSWYYATWFQKISDLNRRGVTFDRESMGFVEDGNAWCAMFYSCMAQSIQRREEGPLLYNARCENLVALYCGTDADVCLFTDSYFASHLMAGIGGDLKGQVAQRLSGVVSNLSVGTVQGKLMQMELGQYQFCPGDLVFFHWKNDSAEPSANRWITHIGIVCAYDETTGNVTVVEGNRNSGGAGARNSEVACTTYYDFAENNATSWELSKKNFMVLVRPAYRGEEVNVNER